VEVQLFYHTAGVNNCWRFVQFLYEFGGLVFCSWALASFDWHPSLSATPYGPKTKAKRKISIVQDVAFHVKHKNSQSACFFFVFNPKIFTAGCENKSNKN